MTGREYTHPGTNGRARLYDHDQIARMIRRGVGTAEIAQQVGCSKETVRRVRMKVAGKQKPLRAGLAERLEKAAEMIEDRVSHTEIARTLHMSTLTLRNHFPDTAWTNEEALDFAVANQKRPRRKGGITPGDGDPRHGTMNGYTNLKCPCDECKAWMSGYYRQLRGGTTPKNPGKYNVEPSTGNGLKTSYMIGLEQSLGLD